jgi:flotillin
MSNLFENIAGGGSPLLWSIAGIVGFFIFIGMLKVIIKVTLPDQLLVVTGRKRKRNGKVFGFSVERGRTSKVPYLQSVDTLDLGILPINVRVEGVNSANGITVGADATACVCVDDDDESMLYSAVERLMGKNREQIRSQIQQTLVGNFRGALNKATPLQAIGMEDTLNEDDGETPIAQLGERAQFRYELLKDINSDLSSFGMKVVSVSLQKIWDTSNYIGNLAQKTLAEKRKQVEIEEARLHANAAKAESDAEKRINIAKSLANEQILSSREKLEVYRRESTAAIEQASLEAEQAISEGRNRGENEVQSVMVEVQKLENRTKVTLKAGAEEKAAQILAEGEKEATEIYEKTRNDILSQKVEMLSKAGDAGKAVLFIQQQLPGLFEAYRLYASQAKVDNYLVMNDDEGFNDAVNRGPGAFGDFLHKFRDALGVDIKSFVSGKGGQE